VQGLPVRRSALDDPLPGRRYRRLAVRSEGADFTDLTQPSRLGLAQAHTRLGKSRIESAPPLEADAPVSRQYEIDYIAHFGWPVYWQDTGVWAAGAFPQPLFSDHARVALKEPEMIEATGDPNLRSVAEVKGYEIKARDGMIGHVDDFILDDENWTVRYLVVDTRKWLIGKRVLVSPLWVADVRWDQREVEVDLTRAQVKDSPEFKPDEPVNRTYEARLYDYYGRPHYW
jgi:hypothetical protein